jgi:hypothetical protein
MRRPIAWVLSALLSASLACATLTGGGPDSLPPTPGASGGPTSETRPTAAADATGAPLTTPEDGGGDEPLATGDTTPSAPHPVGAGPVRIARWELQVNSSATGDEARALLEGAGGTVFDPIEGNEYVVVNLMATYAGPADDAGAIFSGDLVLIDQTGVGRTSATLATLEPVFDATDVPGGESVTGNLVYEMPAGSGPYVLGFSTYNDDFLLEWGFLATAEGAAVAEIDFPDGIQENEVGLDRAQPAGLNQQAVTANWALTVEEVIRGDEAAQILAGGNSFNPTPGEGREFLLARIRMVSGSLGPITYMSTINFTVEEADGSVTGAPFVVLADRPGIDVFLVTGVEYTGWLVMDVPADDPDALIVFDGSDSYANIAPRYFRLGP